MTIEELQAELDRVWPWLEASLVPYGDTHRKEHVLARILAGKAQLWTEDDAACVTTVEKYDTGLLEVYGWLAGGNLKTVQQIVARIEAWAKANGINRARIEGRRGWVKALPGYRELATVICKEL